MSVKTKPCLNLPRAPNLLQQVGKGVCVCVCVSERERERERKRGSAILINPHESWEAWGNQWPHPHPMSQVVTQTFTVPT